MYNMGLSHVFFSTAFTPNFKKHQATITERMSFFYLNFPRDMEIKCGYFPRTEDSWNTEFSVQNWENPGQSEIVDHLTYALQFSI